MTAGAMGILLILGAALLDQLIGDPSRMLHPVVVMGWWIRQLRCRVEQWAGDHPIKLRCGGGLISLILVLGSALAGWCLERLLWLPSPWQWLGVPILTVGLASALAARSLTDSVLAVLEELPATDDGDLDAARRNLGWIVGRDVQNLNQAGLLRAAAETASENAVDGVFAPLFWMGTHPRLHAGLPFLQISGEVLRIAFDRQSSTKQSSLNYVWIKHKASSTKYYTARQAEGSELHVTGEQLVLPTCLA